MPETKVDFLSILAQSNLLDSIPCAIFLKNTESRFIGCNKFLANLAGFSDGKEIIGKSDDEMPWSDELIHYHTIDQSVMKKEKTVEIVESIRLYNKKIIAKTTKAPLYYQGKMIGIIGCFFDITEIKNNENELNKAKEKTDAMNTAALQVAHDIRSPLAAISMLTKACAEIPETQRIGLREAVERIQDIANQLLSKHGKKETPMENNILSPMLVSTALLSVVSSKRVEYQHSKIKIHFESGSEAYFSFIYADVIELKRMVSNLINNAIEARKGDSAKVRVTINKNSAHLILNVIDNGKGMSDEKISQILNDETIITEKKTGFGLGLTHTKNMLKKLNAKLNIFSSGYDGTKIEIIFDLIPAPVWMAKNIKLNMDDCVVVLDDDQSIHGAWDEIFSELLKENTTLNLRHFTYANECVDYINSCKNSKKILLLTDYELIGQAMNGLDVIEKTQVHRAVLVTSHYENQEVIKRVNLLNTKILPKMLATHVPLIIKGQNSVDSNELIKMDLILLDDCPIISFAVLDAFQNRPHKIYSSPYAFLEEINLYHKDTKICTDYLLNSSMNGLDIAKILHEKGFINLYMATGYPFKPGELPSYLHLLQSKFKILEL